jgi:hypothetical protein
MIWAKFLKPIKTEVSRAAGFSGFAVTSSGRDTNGSCVYFFQARDMSADSDALKREIEKAGAYDASWK